MPPGVEHANRVEVQTLGFPNRQYGAPDRFGNVGWNRFFERDHGQTLASGECGKEVVQFEAGCGRAVYDLIRGVVLNRGVTGSAGPVLLLQMAVKVPDVIDQLGDAARAAEIGGELELGGRANLGVQEIAQPAPFKISGPDGLGFVTCEQKRDR